MNRTTKTIVSVMGIFFAIGGIDHGLFEILHGSTSTNGLFIQAIDAAHRFWIYGTEDAFTIVPNFLITGSLAIMFSLAIMVWLVGFIHTRHGPSIFFLLFICLFLVGGGVGQVFFFLPTWAVSTRINKPLTWWRKSLPESIRHGLARLWTILMVVGLLCFLIALEIAIFGFVPGVNNPDLKNYICWTILGVGLVTFLFTFAAGFARDIQLKSLE
jgi:hypothetical protein